MAVTVTVNDYTEEGDFPFVTIDDDGVKEYLRSIGLAYHDTPAYTLTIAPAPEPGAEEVEVEEVEEPKTEVLVEPEEKKSFSAKVFNEPVTSTRRG